MDGIPPEILGENINKLYNKKTALQGMLVPVEVEVARPFDVTKALLSDAAQI